MNKKIKILNDITNFILDIDSYDLEQECDMLSYLCQKHNIEDVQSRFVIDLTNIYNVDISQASVLYRRIKYFIESILIRTVENIDFNKISIIIDKNFAVFILNKKSALDSIDSIIINLQKNGEL